MALPLVNGIYSQLCELLQIYFVDVNVWTKQIFSVAQYTYKKDDLASKQRPALFVVPLRSSKNSFSGQQGGTVILEIHLPLTTVRDKLTSLSQQIVNLIELIFLNGKLTDYVQTAMPWLWWVGKTLRVDYSKVFAKEAMVRMEVDFAINLQAYQKELQAQGKDITSPDEVIYGIVESVKETIVVLDENFDPHKITP